ncbi:cytochrome c oxidase assembly protein [Virgibacillus dakarensis]|nr:cytochrome c oxidase assembly protein [Lentibacillus populi]MBT2215231.1 cytochrome c oxidase assembly protein [Virgibacillus dakarensis]
MFDKILLLGPITWHIPFLTGLLCIASLYVFFVKRVAKINLTHPQVLLFLFGIGLLYVITGSPLAKFSHLSSSLHMTQMSILYFIVPPVILLGIPKHLFEFLWKTPWMKKICKLLLPSMIALITFAILFFMYHLPIVLTVLTKSNSLHNGYLSFLFVLSFGMWWPIATPDPKQRLSNKQKKRYALLSGLILMPACVLFILNALFDGTNNPLLAQATSNLCFPLQSGSGPVSLLPPPFNTKLDQLAAGVFMMGLHKIGLMITVKLGGKEANSHFAGAYLHKQISP